LPSNLALCVHPDFTYIKIHDPKFGSNFILHENLLTTLYKDPKKADFKKIGQFKGSDMKGWRYTPLFDYFTEQVCGFGTILAYFYGSVTWSC
jgi:isoleucyl-tRNA synthetase